jgi:hypothetical protein
VEVKSTPAAEGLPKAAKVKKLFLAAVAMNSHRRYLSSYSSRFHIPQISQKNFEC